MISFQNADAQFFKKLKERAKQKAKNLENKVVNKVDQTVDKTIDKTLEGNPKQNQENTTTKNNKDFGDVTINHSTKYGNVAITEANQIKVNKTNSGYEISGNWWSHQADIYDGFIITLKTDKNLKDDANTGNLVFKIPEDASMKIGYDPQLPYNKKSQDNFVRAVTDDYQNYDVISGEVKINVLSDAEIKVSFSGNVKLREVIREANSDDFSERFYEASISGGITGNTPKFISAQTITQNTNNQTATGSGRTIIPQTSSATAAPGTYNFTYEAVTKMTVSDQNRTYTMSYLINPNSNYFAMKANMSEYSDDEMQGESIIVMDKGNAHIFVETGGMKMRMSSGMMGQQMENPADQMANYDYNNLTKTGNTKTILGATCHEYKMSDSKMSMSLWIAPSVKLPNWFAQNNNILNGYIMEYSIQSPDGNMKSEVVELKENINKTINPKEYKKMF
jgi:hypothetical protein